MFKAILLSKNEGGTVAELASLDEDRLPAGEVTVRVAYSGINYKDALAITGKSPVVRAWPMVPGIDFAGTVAASSAPGFKEGDQVIANGWGMGEARWGGLAQMARVPASFLTPLPAGLTPAQAMAVGTAGYTAMLCINALQDHEIAPGDGDVVVTGANGGVGSFAVALLARMGYSVHAVTGRPEEAGRLRDLGASEVLPRESLSAPGKPLQKERWRAAVDSVGSHTLANVCAGLKYQGVATACGLAQGMDFPATVAPFILRGVTLVGIDSVQASPARRARAWADLAACLDDRTLAGVAREVGLGEVIGLAPQLLAGKVTGRIAVDVWA